MKCTIHSTMPDLAILKPDPAGSRKQERPLPFLLWKQPIRSCLMRHASSSSSRGMLACPGHLFSLTAFALDPENYDLRTLRLETEGGGLAY
jgi:hypothetical protein